MNWAEEVARGLIEKYPDREIYTVASGVSPSGLIHIGNFREIVTTYFVAHELKKLGKNVRYILSFDDYDRFRKVPGGIDPSFDKYVGMPYTSMPSPFNTDKSYAREMEDVFLNELARLDIVPECIYQTEEYKSKRYIKYIRLAMKRRFEIFDILAKYKTQEFTEEEKLSYYPINIYCDTCGKDSVTVTSYDVETGDMTYKCACGNEVSINIDDATNIKLQWKVDWPMRWMVEEVIFEPGGRDHSSATGSYVVAKEIAKEIFGYEAPKYIPYEFIGIKGGGTKMSSSLGNVLTLTELLKVYDKHLILWFYAKYKPDVAFDIALDNDVIRYYSEFDRFVKQYFNGTIDEKNKSIISLTNVTEDYLNNPSFNYMAAFLPMVNYNVDMLKQLLQKENIDCENTYFNDRLDLARNWVESYGKDYQIRLVNAKNDGYYVNLTDIEKDWIKETVMLLDSDYSSSDELQTLLYAVAKVGLSDEKEIKDCQRRYFQILYNLLLNSDKGPKIGLFLMAISKEKVKELLTF
jgi:lysyl-tRNA synthetase, class I